VYEERERESEGKERTCRRVHNWKARECIVFNIPIEANFNKFEISYRVSNCLYLIHPYGTTYGVTLPKLNHHKDVLSREIYQFGN